MQTIKTILNAAIYTLFQSFIYNAFFWVMIAILKNEEAKIPADAQDN